MPMSVFDHGRGVFSEVVGQVTDPATVKSVQSDFDRLWESPFDHGLETWDWKGIDDAPWPTKIALLGGTVWVRYAAIEGHRHPAVIAASFDQELENPLLAP